MATRCKCGHIADDHLNGQGMCYDCDCMEYEPAWVKRPSNKEVAAAAAVMSARHNNVAAPWEDLHVFCGGVKREKKGIGDYLITVRRVE